MVTEFWTSNNIRFHIPGCSYVPITNVYPIVVGPKGQRHNAIESVLYKDIEELSKKPASDGLKVFDGLRNCLRLVSAELIACMQDQPEQ